MMTNVMYGTVEHQISNLVIYKGIQRKSFIIVDPFFSWMELGVHEKKKASTIQIKL
jgi:hypothetical protein